jgi:predicted  nucleic acid-binding Zn-ribbon protein
MKDDETKRKLFAKKLEAAETEILTLQKNINDLKGKYNQAISEKEALEDVNEKIKTINSSYDKLKNNVSSIESAITKVEEIELFFTDTENYNFYNYTKALKDSQQLITNNETIVQNITNKIANLNTDIDNINKIIEDKENDFKTIIEDKSAEFETKIQKFNTQSGNATQQFQKAKQDYEALQKTLEAYAEKAVSGSLFAGFEKRMEKMDKSSSSLTIASVILLFLSGIGLFAIMLGKSSNYSLSFGISLIFAIASYICSSNAKASRKLAEEYAHKANLMQSFVGYRKHFQDNLSDTEYDEFFKEIMEALKSNASDKVDKYLKWKMPWEKAGDVIKDVSSKIADNIDSFKSK